MVFPDAAIALRNAHGMTAPNRAKCLLEILIVTTFFRWPKLDAGYPISIAETR